MSWGWLDQGFEKISELHNPLLKQLISTGRLKLRFPRPNLDAVDVHSACLIGGSLATRTPLCLVLPDTDPKRPAFLFAYALLGSWMRLREVGLSYQRPVLYCGVRPGIREQLSQVSISGLGVTLDGIFDQVHLSRGATSDKAAISSQGLPPVITAYGPADARELLETINPAFVAIDLADAPKAGWLSDLLIGARQRNIPVVAWSTNPLSEAVAQFAEAGKLVKFPTCRSYGVCDCFGSEETSELLFQPFITTTVRPLIVAYNEARDHNENLKLAIECLRTIGTASQSSLVQSAVQLHWRLVRAIESLAVPFSFYEAESIHIWGLRPIATLIETCRHFQSSIKNVDREAARQLERTTSYLDEVISFVSKNEPPLWAALTNLVHSEPPSGQARVILFPSQSRKEMFLLALLARLNITPGDLEAQRVWVTTLSELQLLAENPEKLAQEAFALSIPEGLELVPILVGLPTMGQQPRLLPFFFSEDAEILIHDYQRNWMRPSVRRWNDSLSPNFEGIANAVDSLIRRPILSHTLPKVSDRVALSVPTVLSLDAKTGESPTPESKALWDTPELEDEVGYLFEDGGEDISAPQSDATENDEAPSDGLIVETAYEISFSGGWRGLFANNQQLNFIAPTTRKVEDRFVRAIREGDTMLIIPSQPRQSLYSLIISRVHQHPSIELHLALLRRWREELQSGYQRWAASHRDDPTGALLRELRAAGSTITSHLAVYFWLNGATLCPNDTDDVLRVAEALNLPFVRSRYRQIANAASRIRGLHRGLSNRLNRWLNDRARSGGGSHDAEVIDPTLGLTFGDLRSSLIVADVLSIREVPGPFLRDTLGYIQRATDNDTRRAIA